MRGISPASAHGLCAQRKEGLHVNWAKRVLWFVFGVAATGLLMFISTSQAVEPRQELPQRVTALEQRVAALEKHNKDKAEWEAKKERQERNAEKGRP
jgi:hypothetical protein